MKKKKTLTKHGQFHYVLIKIIIVSTCQATSFVILGTKLLLEVGEPGLLYKYKGIVPIPSLGLMDDNLTVSEAGHKAEQLNVFMNEHSAEKNLQFNPKKCKFLSIGRNKEKMLKHTLEVDTWNISYDDSDILVETEGIKKNMIEVSEIKYLGFVIAENASYVPNILDKKKKSNGTIRSITTMIKGLETYTIQNGLVYLNSLLRSSILYAAETYYNLSERNLRMLDDRRGMFKENIRHKENMHYSSVIFGNRANTSTFSYSSYEVKLFEVHS